MKLSVLELLYFKFSLNELSVIFQLEGFYFGRLPIFWFDPRAEKSREAVLPLIFGELGSMPRGHTGPWETN